MASGGLADIGTPGSPLQLSVCVSMGLMFTQAGTRQLSCDRLCLILLLEDRDTIRASFCRLLTLQEGHGASGLSHMRE